MTPFARDNLRRSLEGKKVLLGISGSIAAFKAHDIIRILNDCGATVRVVLTPNAERFVTRVTLETLTGQPVLTSLWNDDANASMQGTHHIDSARWADVALIAPATANTIAKLALGLADDLLSTELLAFEGPVLVAPAMNPTMYSHPAVQKNLTTLTERGVRVLGPATGVTACREEGPGRMLEPREIVEQVARVFYSKSTGQRAVITLGPTRSPIDPVRYLTNRSSGLMGAALAWAAVRAGFEVTAICGPTDAELPGNIEVISVETADQMGEASLTAWNGANLFIGAAAVLDWDIANPSDRKLKKEEGTTPHLEFKRNIDILAEVSRRKTHAQFVLGFAAETETPLANARTKLATKGCDAIFVNDVSRPNLGFESQTNAGWWLSGDDESAYEFGPCSKVELATGLMALCLGHVPANAILISLDSDDHLHATTAAGIPNARLN